MMNAQATPEEIANVMAHVRDRVRGDCDVG